MEHVELKEKHKGMLNNLSQRKLVAPDLMNGISAQYMIMFNTNYLVTKSK